LRGSQRRRSNQESVDDRSEIDDDVDRKQIDDDATRDWVAHGVALLAVRPVLAKHRWGV
jgi:hypothetical protein